MNILIFSDHGFGYGGGLGVYCNILAQINRFLGNNVIKVGIYGKVRLFYNNAFFEFLNKIVKKNRIDLIHANILNPRVAYLFSRLMNQLKVPWVITVHTWVYLCPTEWNVRLKSFQPCCGRVSANCVSCVVSEQRLLGKSSKEIIQNILRIPYNVHSFRSLIRNAYCVISPSKEFASTLKHEMNVNAYYVPNPVSQKMLEIEPEPSGDGSIVFIGRLVDKKGVRLLPKLARLLDRKIHVIGHGPLEGWLLQHKPFNIVYHGFTYDEAKFNILKKASVLIAPSLWFEMWNYTVTEAFIVGKPVVAFELGG